MNRIDVKLTPSWDGSKIPALCVKIQTDIKAAAGEPLFQINRVTIFKPFTKLAAPMELSDEGGPIGYEVKEERRPPVTLAFYIPKRDSEGPLTLSYELILQPAGRNPVFDLGFEKGGMNGSGMTFLPAFADTAQTHPGGEASGVEMFGSGPEKPLSGPEETVSKPEETVSKPEREDAGQEYEYHIFWDLSALPAQSKGACSWGEGEVRRRGDAQFLTNTFFAAGLLDSVHLGNFSYYWFSSDRVFETAVMTARIFRYESAFFRDEGEPYSIFARHTDEEERRAGGTALARSYMFVYQKDEQVDPVWCRFLFAHEMVHNWISLEDEPFGTCTWYVEGMAEYYSALLPLKMGAVSIEETVQQLNRRAKEYYENPRIHATNEECGQGLMADRELTRVPYGRGFFYLTHADAMVRKATDGQKCLDDVMYAVKEQYNRDPHAGNELWLSEYGRYVGPDTAEKELQDLQNGVTVIPSADCFEGKITVTETVGHVRTDGKEEDRESCRLWQFQAADTLCS